MPTKNFIFLKKLQNRQGFLLVSVIVSMSVLAILASVTIRLIGPGYRSIAVYQNLAKANSLSQLGFDLELLSLSKTDPWQNNTRNYTLKINQETFVQTQTQIDSTPNTLLLQANYSYNSIQSSTQRTIQKALP